MGNAALQAFKDAPLGETSISDDKCISPKTVSKDSLTLICKTKGISKVTNYETEEGELYFSSKSGTFGKKATVTDVDGSFMAMVKVKSGLTVDSTKIYRSQPSFEGQTADEKNTTEDGEALYLFAVIDTKKKFKTATSTYGIVTGETDGEPVLETLYIGKTLPTMGFYVQIETPEGVCVGKACQVSKFNSNGKCEMSAGVDMFAMSFVAQSVAPGGSAGALAGAGVV